MIGQVATPEGIAVLGEMTCDTRVFCDVTACQRTWAASDSVRRAREAQWPLSRTIPILNCRAAAKLKGKPDLTTKLNDSLSI